MSASATQPATEKEPGNNGAQKDPAELFPWLPCELTLEIPITHFTVGDLLRLGKGSIVESNTRHAGDIPLRVNGLLIGYTEFEVMADRLAVRITELA
jgi:flagellar motor switch/type III secretory pathway protein FliN